MKSLNDYILEKILISKDSKFDKSYINDLEEDFLSITELENDKIYTDIFKKWLSDNNIKEVYCIINTNGKKHYNSVSAKNIPIKYSDIIEDIFNNSKSNTFNMLYKTYAIQMYELKFPEVSSCPLLMVRIYDTDNFQLFYITFLEGNGKI